MKSGNLIMWLIISAFVIVLCSLVYAIYDTSVHYNKAKKELGKTVVLGKDTLTVIDYSFFSSTFTLSNGTKADIDLIESKTK